MNIGRKFLELWDLVIGSHFGSSHTMTVVHDLILVCESYLRPTDSDITNL